MNRRWSNLLLAWIARVLALVLVVLTGYGWWDESQARQEPTLGGAGRADWIWQWAVLTHLLPLLLILLATVVGWRWPLYGAIGFGIYAVLQVLSVGAEWIYLPYVAAPPLLIAVLFFVGWLLAGRKARNVTWSK